MLVVPCGRDQMRIRRHCHFGVEGELLLYLFVVICILY